MSFFETGPLCVCLYVMYANVCARANTCGGQRRPLDVLLYHFLIIPLRHGSQQALVVLLSPPPWCWCYRHMCGHAKIFTQVVMMIQTQILRFAQQILLPTKSFTQAQKFTLYWFINGLLGTMLFYVHKTIWKNLCHEHWFSNPTYMGYFSPTFHFVHLLSLPLPFLFLIFINLVNFNYISCFSHCSDKNNLRRKCFYWITGQRTEGHYDEEGVAESTWSSWSHYSSKEQREIKTNAQFACPEVCFPGDSILSG